MNIVKMFHTGTYWCESRIYFVIAVKYMYIYM